MGHPSISENLQPVNLQLLWSPTKEENRSFSVAPKSIGIFVGISCPHGAPIKGPLCQEFVLDRDWPKDRLLDVEEFLQHQEKWWRWVPRGWLKRKEWLVAKPPRGVITLYHNSIHCANGDTFCLHIYIMNHIMTYSDGLDMIGLSCISYLYVIL